MWRIGQRVLAQTEPELGLGTIVRCDSKSLEISFAIAGVTRRYSTQAPPLRRVILKPGQKAQSRHGIAFVVTQATEAVPGLFTYSSGTQHFLETDLADQIPDQGLVEKFISGPWDEPRTYDLRCAGWELLSRSLNPDIRGLLGARVMPLPHQLCIAHQISKREIPRVLLSDEVGLGKTIEAGLIFSSLRALDRATRVLVLAPRPLKHQWLSELYRRFNELFSVIDIDGEKQEDDLDFVSAQKNITSVEFLLSDERWLQLAMQEPWDLLIVDEAHHLGWSEQAPSPEWQAVQKLSTVSRGLLLLTATPRQQGLETQFGLLHLVDPQRFADFTQFQKESSALRTTGRLARRLFEGDKSPALQEELKSHFQEDHALIEAVDRLPQTGPEEIIKALIDRHGTGRVLIRNRRERLLGFPRRVLHSAPLRDKTRLEWLVEFLNTLASGEKVLLLCSNPALVRKIDTHLQAHTGLKYALFHERMDIVERDRQAAWFANPKGAQLLVSSEIGGEGRNFQFASKLVLYDLPSHPDLLEQRIGRLDRIGQKKDIDIFVPWNEGTSDEVYFRWYKDGLRSFERSWTGGAALMESLRKELHTCLESFDSKKLESLISQTKTEVERLETLNKESVDILVDLNSFDVALGESLKKKIEAVDRDPFVSEYLEALFDHYGVEAEDFDDEGTLKLSAHSLTFIDSFPDLPPGSEILATFERSQALAREDLRLLNQDHPMVKGSLALLLDRDEGRISIAARHGKLRGNQEFEFLFVLQANGPAHLELERYLPVTLIEVSAQTKGPIKLREHTRDAAAELETAWAPLNEELRRQISERFEESLPRWAEEATQLAEQRARELILKAQQSAEDHLSAEHSRLIELRRVNPSVRQEEIDEFQRRRERTSQALKSASARLDAIRLLLS